MTDTRERELAAELLGLLEAPTVGIYYLENSPEVLLYAVVPMEGLPAGIIAAAAHWLYHAFSGQGNLGHLVLLLSQALSKWVGERSKEIPLVG